MGGAIFFSKVSNNLESMLESNFRANNALLLVRKARSRFVNVFGRNLILPLAMRALVEFKENFLESNLGPKSGTQIIARLSLLTNFPLYPAFISTVWKKLSSGIKVCL